MRSFKTLTALALIATAAHAAASTTSYEDNPDMEQMHYNERVQEILKHQEAAMHSMGVGGATVDDAEKKWGQYATEHLREEMVELGEAVKAGEVSKEKAVEMMLDEYHAVKEASERVEQALKDHHKVPLDHQNQVDRVIPPPPAVVNSPPRAHIPSGNMMPPQVPASFIDGLQQQPAMAATPDQAEQRWQEQVRQAKLLQEETMRQAGLHGLSVDEAEAAWEKVARKHLLDEKHALDQAEELLPDSVLDAKKEREVLQDAYRAIVEAARQVEDELKAHHKVPMDHTTPMVPSERNDGNHNSNRNAQQESTSTTPTTATSASTTTSSSTATSASASTSIGAPAYLSIAGVEGCLGENSQGSYTTVCLPATMPTECTESAWDQLTATAAAGNAPAIDPCMEFDEDEDKDETATTQQKQQPARPQPQPQPQQQFPLPPPIPSDPDAAQQQWDVEVQRIAEDERLTLQRLRAQLKPDGTRRYRDAGEAEAEWRRIAAGRLQREAEVLRAEVLEHRLRADEAEERLRDDYNAVREAARRVGGELELHAHAVYAGDAVASDQPEPKTETKPEPVQQQASLRGAATKVKNALKLASPAATAPTITRATPPTSAVLATATVPGTDAVAAEVAAATTDTTTAAPPPPQAQDTQYTKGASVKIASTNANSASDINPPPHGLDKAVVIGGGVGFFALVSFSVLGAISYVRRRGERRRQQQGQRSSGANTIRVVQGSTAPASPSETRVTTTSFVQML